MLLDRTSPFYLSSRGKSSPGHILFPRSPRVRSRSLRLDPLMAAPLAALPSCLLLSFPRCNNENEWYQIQENIIRKSNTKYSAPSTNYGKCVIAIDPRQDCMYILFSSGENGKINSVFAANGWSQSISQRGSRHGGCCPAEGQMPAGHVTADMQMLALWYLNIHTV